MSLPNAIAGAERVAESAAVAPSVDAVLTVDEAAKYLRCGPRAVRRLIRLRRIKAQRISGTREIWRIHRAAIDAFLLGEKGRAA
jgi:excisionase family DNA binding protein